MFSFRQTQNTNYKSCLSVRQTKARRRSVNAAGYRMKSFDFLKCALRFEEHAFRFSLVTSTAVNSVSEGTSGMNGTRMSSQKGLI